MLDIEDFSPCTNCQTKECGLIDGNECERENFFRHQRKKAKMHYIASCSFGKDSLAMVLRLMEENRPLDEIVFYDTGMEFQAIYNVRDRLLPLLAERGIEYTELKPKMPFLNLTNGLAYMPTTLLKMV